MQKFALACGLLATLVLPRPALAADAGSPRLQEAHPLVIGHRGASGYLPEHTLEAYALAIEMGADYIEPDLVATRDGHLIARHEPMLGGTTDVASRPEFADRRTTKMLDGVATEDFFASDFTLAEIKTLRARQSRAGRPAQFDGLFEIPTFEQVIELAKRKSRAAGRTIGVYPETKHPSFHDGLGLSLEEPLVAALERAGWNRKGAPVFIQSFEQSNLKALRRMTPVRLVQLVDANDALPDGTMDFTPPFDRPYDWTASGDPRLLARTFGYFLTPEGLAEIATYADGVGPWKRYLVRTAGGEKIVFPEIVANAHAAGLMLHTWTFRSEQAQLLPQYGGNPLNEYFEFYGLGVDGVFSDFPDTAVAARTLHEIATDPRRARCLTGTRSGPRRELAECSSRRD
jgi:glycerophosphoryl diester phosphodiesterase